jgi:hypothetical protein
MLLHHARAKPDNPVAADITLLEPDRTHGTEAERFDHHPRFCPPQPGAAGDDWMWRRQRQRTAGERQAIRDQLRAKGREKLVGARHGARDVDQPGEGRGKPHAGIMRLRPVPVIAYRDEKWSCA